MFFEGVEHLIADYADERGFFPGAGNSGRAHPAAIRVLGRVLQGNDGGVIPPASRLHQL